MDMDTLLVQIAELKAQNAALRDEVIAANRWVRIYREQRDHARGTPPRSGAVVLSGSPEERRAQLAAARAAVLRHREAQA